MPCQEELSLRRRECTASMQTRAQSRICELAKQGVLNFVFDTCPPGRAAVGDLSGQRQCHPRCRAGLDAVSARSPRFTSCKRLGQERKRMRPSMCRQIGFPEASRLA